MNDIAAEAGIARQTLYGSFSNKDAVMQATIQLMADRAITGIETDLEAVTDLGDQLDVVFRHIAIEPFELLNASPNSADIVEGFNASSQKELAAAAERNRLIIAQILKPANDSIKRCGLTRDEFADFIQRSASSAKYNAKDPKHLLRLLTALRVAVLKVTE
jgi:AcrR family transcriptional regulator